MEKTTKERILEEAVRLFSRRGYMGTSMSDIAGQLGITKAALYKRYTGKQEILDCIIQRIDAMELARMRQYAMPEGCGEQLAAGYRELPLERIRQFAAARDGLDRTIQCAIDGSCDPGLFPLMSIPTAAGCIGAAVIVLAALAALLSRSQHVREICFAVMSGGMAFKIAVLELSRLIIGG